MLDAGFFETMVVEMELEEKFPGFSKYPASVKEVMVLCDLLSKKIRTPHRAT